MNNNEPENLKPHVNIGMIGHNQHGKTMLINAIYKVLLREKGNEDITISKTNIVRDLPVVTNIQHEIDEIYCNYIDIENSWHNNTNANFTNEMSQFDAAILVVAATDGPMLQTLEQLQLCSNLGISIVAVFVNKCDMGDDIELQNMVAEETRDILNIYGFNVHKTPIIYGSALKAFEGNTLFQKGILELTNDIETLIENSIKTNKKKKLRF